MAFGSSPKIFDFAKKLRKEQTPLEASLWKHLRAGRMQDYKFRRQHPIAQYIVDFYCEEAKLVIELDGDSHAEQEDYDKERTAFLAGLGYRVLRFTNRDVHNNINGVLELILENCTNSGK